MTDQLPDEVAFAFLSDVKKKFIQTYEYEKIANFRAYQLKEFNDVLKGFMVMFQLYLDLL